MENINKIRKGLGKHYGKQQTESQRLGEHRYFFGTVYGDLNDCYDSRWNCTNSMVDLARYCGAFRRSIFYTFDDQGSEARRSIDSCNYYWAFVFATGECTWVIIVTFAVAGILGEAARKVLGYKSFKGIALAGGFTAFGFIGSPLPMWLFQDAYMKSIEEMGMGVEYVEGLQSMISAGSFIGMLAVAFVGGLIGTLVGRLMLKKHFEKAGIV